MLAMPRLRLLVAVILGPALAALLAFAAFSATADAKSEPTGPITIENHSWGGYHWARTSNPFTLKTGDNVSSDWDSYLNTTVTDWSKSTVLDLAKVAGSGNPKPCKAPTGQVMVCNSTYGFNGWLGIAGITISGSHITTAYVKVNDSYFNTSTYNTPAWRNLVMCQEVGHTLGLDHQDENFDNANLGTCMDYSNDPSTNQHPNQHDYDMLQTIYSHLDSSTTLKSRTANTLPPEANQDESERPENWGRLIWRSPDGMVELWERDFGGGVKKVRWVIKAQGKDKQTTPVERTDSAATPAEERTTDSTPTGRIRRR